MYITEKDMKKVKSNYNSATGLARGLVRMVFTQEARETCSVSGKPSMVKGQEKPEVRTALAKDGVDAITGTIIFKLIFQHLLHLKLLSYTIFFIIFFQHLLITELKRRDGSVYQMPP